MEQILTRFPDKQAEIEQHLENDPDFQEMCEDYLDVVALLHNHNRQAKKDAAAIADYYRAVIKELEAEIEEVLRSTRAPPDASDLPNSKA